MEKEVIKQTCYLSTDLEGATQYELKVLTRKNELFAVCFMGHGNFAKVWLVSGYTAEEAIEKILEKDEDDIDQCAGVICLSEKKLVEQYDVYEHREK